jgi:hypothetical protein
MLLNDFRREGGAGISAAERKKHHSAIVAAWF